MDSQSLYYWVAQGYHNAALHQTTFFELLPGLSKVPSLRASPVCSVGSINVKSIYLPCKRFRLHTITLLHPSLGLVTLIL
jgi:hypothetical protein